MTEPLRNGSAASHLAAAQGKLASHLSDDGLSDVVRDLSQLISSFRSLLGNADSLLSGVLGSSADSAKHTGEQVVERLGEQLSAGWNAGLNAATDSSKRARQVIHDQVKSGGQTAQRYVNDNPWRAMAIAAAVAGVVAYLMPRR